MLTYWFIRFWKFWITSKHTNLGNNYIFESLNCKNKYNYFKISSLQNPSGGGTIVLFLMLIFSYITSENTKPDVSFDKGYLWRHTFLPPCRLNQKKWSATCLSLYFEVCYTFQDSKVPNKTGNNDFYIGQKCRSLIYTCLLFIVAIRGKIWILSL